MQTKKPASVLTGAGFVCKECIHKELLIQSFKDCRS